MNEVDYAGKNERCAEGVASALDETPLVASPLLTEVLTLSDEALVCFVDFIRLNHPSLTRDPNIIRRVFMAYAVTDYERVVSGQEAS